MVRARETRGPLTRALTLATVATLGLVSAGCTMCPDPFDYSGPVPNGSSPQNDFRARSNGILPLGAAPKPWPLLVKDAGGESGGPHVDEQSPTLAEEPAAAGAEANNVEQTVAVFGESEGDTVEGDGTGAAGDASAIPPRGLEPVPGSGDVTEPGHAAAEEAHDVRGEQPPTMDVTQVRPATPASPMLPPVQTGETPGWRARRR